MLKILQISREEFKKLSTEELNVLKENKRREIILKKEKESSIFIYYDSEKEKEEDLKRIEALKAAGEEVDEMVEPITGVYVIEAIAKLSFFRFQTVKMFETRFENHILDLKLLKPRQIREKSFMAGQTCKDSCITFFTKVFDKAYPQECTAFNHFRMSLLLHYYNYNYTSNRLLMGFPIKGQRTRTNAKTSKKINSMLHEMRLHKGFTFYGNLPKSEVDTAVRAEYVNIIYKLNFYSI